MFMKGKCNFIMTIENLMQINYPILQSKYKETTQNYDK